MQTPAEWLAEAQDKQARYLARQEADKVRLARVHGLPIHCAGMLPPRNALCPCGSGKKYKICCAQHAAREREAARVEAQKQIEQAYAPSTL